MTVALAMDPSGYLVTKLRKLTGVLIGDDDFDRERDDERPLPSDLSDPWDLPPAAEEDAAEAADTWAFEPALELERDFDLPAPEADSSDLVSDGFASPAVAELLPEDPRSAEPRPDLALPVSDAGFSSGEEADFLLRDFEEVELVVASSSDEADLDAFASRVARLLTGPRTGTRATNTQPTPGTGFPPQSRPSVKSHS